MNGMTIKAEEADIRGQLSALAFAVENLWAAGIKQGGGTAADAREVGREMLRQYEDLPMRGPPITGEGIHLLQQHGINRLEQIFAAVESRLASAGAPPTSD